MTDIGIRIKNRREELGLTQEELAKRLGYTSRTSRSTISKVEKGINDLTQSMVVKYADALDCSIAYLMGWEEDPVLQAYEEHQKSLDNIPKYQEDLAEMAEEVGKREQLLEDFSKLSEDQQLTVLALLHSMVSDKGDKQ